MTPKDFAAAYVEEKRRRFHDQPAFSILQIVYTALKVIVGITFLWFVKAAGGVVMDHRPMKELQTKQTQLLEKMVDVQSQNTTDIRVLQAVTTSLEKRVDKLER